MARELPDRDGLPERTTRQIDWSRFDTGKPWVLTWGTDFDQEPAKAAKAARQWAYYHQRKVSIKIDRNQITLLIYPHGAQ